MPATTSATSETPRRRPRRLKAVSPRNLEHFTNSRELVFTMLGAVVAHQKLYEVAGYLHGDINTNTIIMLEWPGGKREGALVDYDIPYSVEGLRHMFKPWRATPNRYANRYTYR